MTTPRNEDQSSDNNSFHIDGKEIKFSEGQTILSAALEADVFIPHLCYNAKFQPHGSCRVCMVNVNGQSSCACTTQASPNAQVQSDTQELNQHSGQTKRLYVLVLMTSFRSSLSLYC